MPYFFVKSPKNVSFGEGVRRTKEGKAAPKCLFVGPKAGKTRYDTRPDDLKQKPIREMK